MKNFVIILFAIVLCSFNLSTADDAQIENILTSGKWFVESIQESGVEPEMAESKNDEWVIFHKDGNLEQGLYDEVSKATWEYTEKDKMIKVSGNDVVFKKIIEISNDKLTIELIENANSEDNLIVNYVK